MTAIDRNPWQVLVSVWRNAVLAFWRLPILIVGCWLLYTFLSGYWFHGFPINFPRGFASQAGYILLHGVIFGPLIVAVMQTVFRRDGTTMDLWRAGTVWVGGLIVARELVVYEIRSLVRYGMNALIDRLAGHGYGEAAMAHLEVILRHLSFLSLSIYLVLDLTIFLLSVRLILLLPILVVEKSSWRLALSNSWRAMRGNYVFALAVSFAAILPMLLTDRMLGRLSRSLSISNYPHGPISYTQWEELAVRSAQFTLDYILIAALAGALYLAVRSRAALVTVP